MGAKVAANETDLENISTKHRPMTITDDYVQLQSEQWCQAKDYLSDSMQGASEREIINHLSNALEV